MKKTLFYLITLFLLLHTTIVKSQERNEKWINIIVGVNAPMIVFQNAYGNPEFEYSPKVGLTGGTGISYFINKDWGVNLSLLVTQMGQNYKGIQSGGDAKRKVKLLYLEAPLIVTKKVLFTSKPVWLSLGPDFFFLLNANQEYQRTGGVPLPKPEVMDEGKIKERINPVDISLYIALSQFYSLNESSRKNLVVSLNTSIGLTDINSADWKTPQPDGTYSGSHNFYMGIKVGLMLNTEKEKSWDSSF